MISRFKSSLVGTVGAACASRLAIRAIDRVFPGYQILVYHRVLAQRDPFAIAPVDAAEFAAQMKLLKSCYRVISLDQLTSELDDERLGPGTVCVTFDDGYRDNFEVAFPILESLGLPAAIFLATDFISGKGTLWYDRVLNAFRHSGRPDFSLPEAGMVREPLRILREGHHPAYRVLEWLKGFSPSERDSKIPRILEALGLDAEPACDLMLDWDQVRAMRGRGIQFGAHTRSHPILSTVDNESNEIEILGSKRILESELEEPVRHFAYPNGRRGDYGEAAKAALRKGGFASALTTNPGINLQGQDRFEMLRSQPWERSIARFHGRMIVERALG